MKVYASLTNTTMAEIVLGPGSNKLIVRSTESADTGNVYIKGVAALAAATSVMALTGDLERETSRVWDTITRIVMDAPTGAVSFRRPGTKAAGSVDVATNPADGETLILGVAGHTVTFTFKSTLSSGGTVANEVKIDANRFLTARNLADAINHLSGSGTEWGSATAVHPQLSAYSDIGHTSSTLNGTSHSVVYLQDKLGCDRQLGWTVSGTSIGNLTFSYFTGGVDGDLVVEIGPGQLGAGQLLTLDDNAATNIDDSINPTFDAIATFGRQSRLYVIGDSSGHDVTFSIKAGFDTENLLEQESISSDGTNIVQSSVIGPAEFVQISKTSSTGDVGVIVILVF